MTSAKFKTLYRQLNSAQREAVDTIDGPVMVVAGPGTGKTQILTLRIANILRLTDTSPDSILALTFTNSGVHSMRERLVETIGSRAFRVGINTFHGFCNDLIKRYPEHFPRIVGARPADEAERLQMMEKIIDRSRLTRLKPWNDPYHYLTAGLQAIDRLKKENLMPRDFTVIVNRATAEFEALPDLRHPSGVHAGKIRGKYTPRRTQLGKNRELGILYKGYETALAVAKLYDFSDMVMEVIRVIEADDDFRLMLQEEYQYLLADEHQDANQSQNRLLELLASYYESPNLFIVGDEKQAIFQFQGASLDNFNYFRRLYPRARLITLTDNYRSTQTILDAAHSVIMESQAVGAESRAKLISQSTNQDLIRVYAAPDPNGEQLFLINELKSRIKQGVRPREIAILYRDNRDAPPLIEALERANLPYRVATNTDVLADLDIQKLIALFRVVHHFGDDQYLMPVLHFDFLHLDGLDLHQLNHHAREQKLNLYQLISNLKNLKSLGLHRPEAVSQLYQALERWQKMSRNQTLLNLFGAVINESGFLTALLKQSQAVEKLSRLHTLFDELKRLVATTPNYSLAQLLNHLDTLSRHRVSLGRQEAVGIEGINLSTVHRAKGLEWDYVYIVKAYDGHFGHRRRHADFLLPTRGVSLPLVIDDQEEDERRLFYVALTRARRVVTISFAAAGDDGRRQLPSRFIEEIDKKLINYLVVEREETKSHDFSPPPRRGLGLRHREYLRKLFEQQGLSVTALNNYLRCPLRYYFQNLLRLVRVKDRRLIYGTAMHGALFDFFEVVHLGKKSSENLLLKSFRAHLAKEPLTVDDQKLVLAKGVKALAGYYHQYHPTFTPPIVNELSIRGVLLDPPFRSPRLRLTGQIDKIEPLDDGTVRVVDYKTGRPRPTDDYRRQLIFYKLLLDRWNNGRYKVVEGGLDFLEPTASGTYRREIFTVTLADTEALAVTIRQVAAEILSLKFLDRGCRRPDCDSCRLWAMSQK
ncbi:MAG: ATP-dependent DNA helicase [Patescibacteria group bacterium]